MCHFSVHPGTTLRGIPAALLSLSVSEDVLRQDPTRIFLMRSCDSPVASLQS
jgi:hypothetical protein